MSENSTKPNVRIIEAIKPMQNSGNAAFAGKKIRVAAYARVSTEQDEQQNSYEAQVQYYTNFITNNPAWIFKGVYSDEGISGTNTKKRDGFNNMIKDALNGEIDLILTKSISRFARNTVDTLKIVRELKAKNVEVIFEKENLHTFDPKCEVMLTIMSSLAQEESRSISENVRWGKRKSMQDGKVSLAYSRFLGYKKGADGRPEIVEEEAKIVRDIYDMYISGKTIKEIAETLTNRGIPTPTGKSKWSTTTVRSILGNEKYKGEAILQKTYTVDYLTKEVRKNRGEVDSVVVTNSHEPIIPPETFDFVQDLLQKRTTRKNRLSSRHPFAGKLICGDCGGFCGHKIYDTGKDKVRKNIWYCNHKYSGESPCNSKRIKEENVVQYFTEILKKRNETSVSFTEEKWNELVDIVTIYGDRITFSFSDGKNYTFKF